MHEATSLVLSLPTVLDEHGRQGNKALSLPHRWLSFPSFFLFIYFHKSDDFWRFAEMGVIEMRA